MSDENELIYNKLVERLPKKITISDLVIITSITINTVQMLSKGSGCAKKSLVMYLIQRIISDTSRLDETTKSAVTIFIQYQLPILIDKLIEVAHNPKIIGKNRLGCLCNM